MGPGEEGKVLEQGRGWCGGTGADPMSGSEPSTGNFVRGGSAGCVEGAANLSAGGALGESEPAPAGGVCLRGFFVSPPGPSSRVRPAREGAARGFLGGFGPGPLIAPARAQAPAREVG
jgi:hypothetical protein